MQEPIERYIPHLSDLERERALSIASRVRTAAGGPCPRCGAALRPREVVESVVLGRQDELLCHACHAAEHDEAPAEFLARLLEYIDRVPCFRAAWLWCAGGIQSGRGEGER